MHLVCLAKLQYLPLTAKYLYHYGGGPTTNITNFTGITSVCIVT